MVGFSIAGPQGVTDRLVTLQPATFAFFLKSEVRDRFRCTYGIAIHDIRGTAVTRLISPVDEFEAFEGDVRKVEVSLNPNQIGPGEYKLGISVLEASPVELLNSARRYDLVTRSFQFRVELPESLGPISSAFFHSGEWGFRAVALPEVAEGERQKAKAPATVGAAGEASIAPD